MNANCEYCPNNDGHCKPETDCPLLTMLKEIEGIQSFLEITTSDDPHELVQRLTDINVHMARTGKMLAEAKEYQDRVTANIYARHADYISRVPATVASRFVSSQCATVNRLVTWLERQNRALVHQGDNIRTQVSFAKQDLALQRKGY